MPAGPLQPTAVDGPQRRHWRPGDWGVGRFAPLAVLIALLGAVGSFEPSFLSLYSMTVLAGESAVILLLATAQTVVILLGGIDLSMAALASLASVLMAL